MPRKKLDSRIRSMIENGVRQRYRTLFVIVGAFLDIFGLYDKFVLYCGAGAIIPITSFGHLLIHGAMDIASEMGPLGLAFGIFDLTSAGISIALVAAFTLSLFCKPKH